MTFVQPPNKRFVKLDFFFVLAAKMAIGKKHRTKFVYLFYRLNLVLLVVFVFSPSN